MSDTSNTFNTYRYSYPSLTKNSFQFTLNNIILACLTSGTDKSPYDFLYAEDKNETVKVTKAVDEVYEYATPTFQNDKVNGFFGVFKVNLASFFNKQNELIEVGCKGYVNSINEFTINLCKESGLNVEDFEPDLDDMMKKQLAILFKKLDYFYHFQPHKYIAFPVNATALDKNGDTTNKDIFTDYFEKYQRMIKQILIETLDDLGKVINSDEALKARNGREINCEVIWDFCSVNMIEDEVIVRVQGEFSYKN